MPIFEYRCDSCGHRYEKLIFGDAPAPCPKCAGSKASRLLSTFAVRGGGQGSGSTAPEMMGAGGCGSCGDPRGPGACRMN